MGKSRSGILRLLAFGLAVIAAPSYVGAAPLTGDNAPWNVNRNPAATTPAEYSGSWEGHSYFPSPSDWRQIGIYSVVTDRFSDGDPRNNDGKYGGYDVRYYRMRQGGDFRGLVQKLDYIRSLGMRAIWISPIFQNRFNSYHGYGQIDFTLLDDRFGTLEDLRALTSEAHKRGMYVIVDIIVNHLENYYVEKDFPGGGAPFRFHTGEYQLRLRKDSERYADFSADNTFVPTGKYCSVYGGDGNRVDDTGPGEGSFWNSDFHHNGTLDDYSDPWNIHLGKIYGVYDDLRLCSASVQSKIIAMTKSLIASTDIDGIRMDTPMQVPLPFFKVWAPEVRRFAASLGKNNFPIFGETFAGRRRTATMIGRGKSASMYRSPETIDDIPVFDGGIDYSFYAGGVDPIFRFGAPESARYPFDTYEIERGMLDLFDPASAQDEYKMLSFIGGHDQRRLRNLPDGSRKLYAATALLGIWPGVPIWYQGDEQGLCSVGTGLEGHGRESMMASIAWSKLPSCESSNPARKDNFDFTNPFFVWTSKLFEARESYPRYFASDEIAVLDFKSDSDPGAVLYRRGTKEDFALVALNLTGSKKTVTIPSRGAIVDLFTGQPYRNATLQLAPWEARLFVPLESFKPLRPRLLSVSPQHGARSPTRRATMELSFSEPMNADSVKRGVRCPLGKAPEKFHVNGATRNFSFSCELDCGINTVMISGDIRSTTGRALGVPIEHRILFGEDRNILVNPDATFDANLVESPSGTVEVPTVTLRHSACGAEFMRVTGNGGMTWEAWEPYAETSTVKLGTINGWQDVWAQYWAAGSGAYIVTSGVDYYNPPWSLVPPSEDREPMRPSGWGSHK